MARRRPQKNSERAATKQEKIGLGAAFFQMISNVLVESMSTGLFLPAAIVILFIIVLVRIPPEEIAPLVEKGLDYLIGTKVLGYTLAVVCALGWIFNIKIIMRQQNIEVKRIIEERNHWQEQVMGKESIKGSEEREE